MVVQLAVSVVFEDQHVLLAGEPVERLATGRGPNRSRRVLEVRNHVNELARDPCGPSRGNPAGEMVDVHTLLVAVDSVQPRSEVLERGRGADVARRLDEDGVPRIQQHSSNEVQSLLGTAQKYRLLRRHIDVFDSAVTMADGTDKTGIAPSHRVLEDLSALLFNQFVLNLAQEFVREHLRVGRTGGEGDHIGLVHQTGELPDKRRAHHPRVGGEESLPIHFRRVTEWLDVRCRRPVALTSDPVCIKIRAVTNPPRRSFAGARSGITGKPVETRRGPATVSSEL